MKSRFTFKNVFTIRNITVMSMMAVLEIILSYFSIYLTPTQKLLTFSFLPGAIVSILMGPWAGASFGFAADFLGFIANPAGSAYFPGYAISKMVTNFIYAVLLYKKPLTVPRVLLSRILIMLSVTFGLNFLWNVIQLGAVASKYFTSVRLLNNLLQLPLYVFLIIFFGKLSLIIYSRMEAKNNL